MFENEEYYQDAWPVACVVLSKLTSDLVTTTRVTALLSDVSPLSAFSNASAKKREGFRVHRTKMTQENEINVTIYQTKIVSVEEVQPG
jgi:hypothetical protein